MDSPSGPSTSGESFRVDVGDPTFGKRIAQFGDEARPVTIGQSMKLHAKLPLTVLDVTSVHGQFRPRACDNMQRIAFATVEVAP